METERIPGYDYGAVDTPSPITMEELALLKETLLFTDDDERYLRMAGEVLADQVEDVLDVWYGYVGSHPHLVRYFATPDGQPIQEYLSAVRRRFGQWILDTCNRPYDRAWLDYQHEIAHRHYRTKKNRTDGVESVPIIHLRYITSFIYPITATIHPFLGKKGHGAEEVEGMYQAWFKAVVLQATLWSQPFVKEGDF